MLAWSETAERIGGAGLTRGAVLTLAIGCFAARAFHTATVYNHTFDEPTQIASGLELLQYGTFELHMDVPPLAKVLLAAPLYAAGVRLATPPRRDSLEDANALLYERTNYWPALRAARAVSTAIGVLLLLGIYAVALRFFGAVGALVAVVAASISPGLVSAASIANSDMLGVATLLLAMLCFRRLLRQPGPMRAAQFALAAAMAVLAKLSALPFLAFSLPVIAAFDLGTVALQPLRHPITFARAHWRELFILAVVPPIAAWACYGFARAPAVGPVHAAQLASSLGPSHPQLAAAAQRLATLRLPLGGFLRSVGVASAISRAGHPAFLDGAYSLHGWPWYFLVTIVLKVPIGILAAVALALALAVGSRRGGAVNGSAMSPGLLGSASPRSPRGIAREVLLLACLCAAILASVARSGINAGHRHVVVVEALFALIAAGGAEIALRGPSLLRSGIASAALAVALVAAGASSLRAHPDALGYFNAFAGPTPDQYLVDSNIDWGQDLERLGRHLRQAGIVQPIHLAYFGSALPAKHGVRALPLLPNQHAAGWIAASVHLERGLSGAGVGQLPDAAHRTGYAWLLSLPPAAHIGTSIRLYNVTPAQLAAVEMQGTKQ